MSIAMRQKTFERIFLWGIPGVMIHLAAGYLLYQGFVGLKGPQQETPPSRQETVLENRLTPSSSLREPKPARAKTF